MVGKLKTDLEKLAKAKWKFGERVLCRYPKGDIFYEAKIIGVNHREDVGLVYKVHYQVFFF